MNVTVKERRSRRKTVFCRDCETEIAECPNRQSPLRRAPEKGVDSTIVTDLVVLAWEGAYDVAILLSSDADFTPAVVALQNRGLKIINATWKGHGADLARSSWASFELDPLIAELTRGS